MTGSLQAERVLYDIPPALAGTEAASPDEIMRAMEDDVDRLLDLAEEGVDLVAVQGQVSSMKTWLLACTAGRLLDQGKRVAVLVPQRANRRSLTERLDFLGIPFIELPGHRDLCAWDRWRELVGRVDERTCSTNGCHLYPANHDRSEEVV